MIIPKLTANNSIKWCAFHSFNYLVGGFLFLVGSILIFPWFSSLQNSVLFSAWCYIIGALAFVLADLMEWLHYLNIQGYYLDYIANYLISLLAAIVYLIGCIFLIPQLKSEDKAIDLFIVGSVMIVISQSWKIYRTLYQSEESLCWILRQNGNKMGAYVSGWLGGLFFLIGSIVFE